MHLKRKPRYSAHEMERQVDSLLQRFNTDVEQGRFQVGERLPGIREIASEYDTTFPVARKLFDYLKNTGRIMTAERHGAVLTDATAVILPGQFLQKRGIAIVASIRMEHNRSRLNSSCLALMSIENECRQAGIPLHFINTLRYNVQTKSSEPMSTETVISELKNKSVAGLIFIGATNEVDQNQVASSVEVPVISIGTICNQVTAVIADEEQMGKIAARHMLDLGHRKIAYLTLGGNEPWFVQRQDGIRKELVKAHVSFSLQNVFQISPSGTIEDKDEIGRRNTLFALIHDQFTAVICANDECGRLLLEYENENALTDDEKVAILTFDDEWDYRMYDMTSIRRAIDVQASIAYRELVKQITTPAAERELYVKAAGNLYVRSTSYSVQDLKPR